MRIAAFSDVHGNLTALRAVLAHITRECAPDLVVNLGDHVSGPLQPAETADLLMNTRHIAVIGNHDRHLLGAPTQMGPSDEFGSRQISDAQRLWIAGLPQTTWLDGGIFLCHGTPECDEAYFLENVDECGCKPATEAQIFERAGGLPAELILCGHTHLQRAFRFRDGRLIVNPGSVGVPAFGSDQPHRHKMESGTPHARYVLLDNDRGWQVKFMHVEYDWNSASRIAAARHRSDWAIALKTGHVE